MENTYGIGIANRYDLFYVDDEAGDPFEALASKKQKGQKKALAATAPVAPVVAPVVNNQTTKTKSKTSEKEKENKTVDPKKPAQGKENSTNTRNERRGIKETQKDNIRSQRDDNKLKPSNENREERNNRRNKEGNVEDKTFQRRPGQNSGRRFDGRGKREYDRQSGSEKTGVKAIDKKDGAGAHNWGSAKQDAEDYSKIQQDLNGELSGDDKPKEQNESKEETKDATEAKTPTEAEPKEMTLDEWKAQKAAARTKPQYNLRKAGEGEESTVWEDMVALDKKKGENESDEHEYDDLLSAQQKQKQKQVLDIEFHFNDGRRTAAGRTRGRGGKNNRNVGGPRPEKRDIEKKERADRVSDGAPVKTDAPMKFAKQPEKSSRFNKNAAPKVDDEKDFPSLG